MENSNIINKEQNENSHLPKWDEIPDIDLYIDQVVSFLEGHLSNYIKIYNERTNEKAITKSMINNYVKHGVIKPPINKKYNKEHIAYLFVIFILKQIYSIYEIKKLITLAIDTSTIDVAYNRFCLEIEKAIEVTFSGINYTDNNNLSQEQYILRNVAQSFANKLYIQKTFLSKY